MTQPRVLIDKASREAYKAQLNVAKVVRETAGAAGLSRVVIELVNMRVSQINGCAFCLDKHMRDAVAGGESTRRLAVLPAWRDTALFSDKERAALTLAELVTTLPDSYAQDREYAFARQHLNDAELSALAWVAVTINSFNRLSIISRHSVHS